MNERKEGALKWNMPFNMEYFLKIIAQWNGNEEVVRVTGLVFTGDVEAKLQRL